MDYQKHGLFSRLRGIVLVFVFLFSGVVVGLSAHLASVLLPYDRDFIIFSLVVSALTIIGTVLIMQRSTPRMESIGLFIFAVLWVAMGGFTVDRVGGVHCVDLAGQMVNTGTNKTMNAQQYCERTKVIMAFSWAEFSILTIMFIIVIILTTRARTHGASSEVWNEDIVDLPWFGTWVGEDRQHYQPTYPFPMGGGYPPSTYAPGGPTAQSRIVIHAPPPGQSVVLRPEDGYQQAGLQPAISYRP